MAVSFVRTIELGVINGISDVNARALIQCGSCPGEISVGENVSIVTCRGGYGKDLTQCDKNDEIKVKVKTVNS